MNMNISEKIKSQQSCLNEWKKDLIKQLLEESSNEVKDIYLFLISGKWLEKYENIFFNKKYNNNDSTLNNKYIKYELIDNNNLFNIHEFIQLPNIFPLNEKCWFSLIRKKEKENEIKIKANFYKHILIFDLNIQCINDRIYCFFYLDKKNIIMQSYIKINNKDKEGEIINCLKNYGALYFISKFINNNPENSNYYRFEDFEMLIFESQNKNINNINNMKIPTVLNNKKKYYTKIIVKKKKDNKNKINQNSSIVKENNMKKEIHKNNNIKCQDFAEKNNNKICKMKKNTEIENEMNPKRIIIPKGMRNPSAQPRFINKDKKLKINKNESPFLFNLFIPKAIHQESSPGIIGLVNIGPVPYMNAVLQCFSNITRLKKELLNKDIYNILESDKNTKKLSFALAEVLKNLWENLKHRIFSPDNFKNVINELNPQIKNLTEDKLIDLISFLLDKLHLELNNPINNNIINNNHNPDHTNLNDVYNYFVQYYNNINHSIISDEFNGIKDKMIICGNCGNTFHNIENYNYLSFNLEEVKKFKQYYNFYHVRINECFEYNERYVFFSYFNCNRCGKYSKSYRHYKFLYMPHTLIINLEHKKENQFYINIVFEELLHLKNYILLSNSPFMYELKGVISHYDSHFIAYCKNVNNNEWYKYDDENVNPISFNEIKENGLHYVLFYSYISSG